MNIGDTVSFHFVHTSACLDDCQAEEDATCDCVQKRFVCRPATVVEMQVDDGSSLRAVVDRIDAALAQSDAQLSVSIDPTDPDAETVAQLRARYAAARDRYSATAEELVKTPAIVLDLDVAFVDQDIVDLGCQRNGQPLTLAEYRADGLAVQRGVRRASASPPVDLHESGTWTDLVK